MVPSSAGREAGVDKRPAVAAPWWGPVWRPLLGLILLAMLTGIYATGRGTQFSDLPKAKPPRPRQVGDDFARLAEATNDPRSVYLVIGQALHDRGAHVKRVVVPRDLENMLERDSRPGGPRVPARAALSRLGLLTGVQPTMVRYPARLEAVQTDEVLRAGHVIEYPMNVLVVESAEGASIADWAVVGDETGARAIVLPTEMLEALQR